MITVLGIGMGNENTLTAEGKEALKNCGLIIGAKRIIDGLSKEYTPKRMALINSEDILKAIKNSKEENICVAMSGDTGFYSGTKKLMPLIKDYDIKVLCGITTVQYMAAKILRPWQDVRLVSAHGTDCNIIGNIISSRECFFLVGGSITPETIIDELNDCGLENAQVYIGENLSYDNEKITNETAANLKGKTFDKLSAVWVIRGEFSQCNIYKGGIEDDVFIRKNVPMTKSEIRSAVIGALQIGEEDIFYDIGAGTGSIGIEAAIMQPMCRVFAFEINDEACELIELNRRKFSAYNLRLIKGKAPESFENITAPTKAFIGGSKGNIKEITKKLLKMNSNTEITATAVTAETFAESLNVFKDLDMEIKITQINVSRTKKVGNYNMFNALNPIFIISAVKGKK